VRTDPDVSDSPLAVAPGGDDDEYIPPPPTRRGRRWGLALAIALGNLSRIGYAEVPRRTSRLA